MDSSCPKLKIGITGASGMLGAALMSHLSKQSHQIFATSRTKGVSVCDVEWDLFDLTNISLLERWLERINPDVVIHCAAIVNVDACENNESLATKLHVEVTDCIAGYLESNNGRLIYISTDSVFDGKKHGSYVESYEAKPLNIYANTKLLGEKVVESMANGLVLRVNIIGTTPIDRSSFAEWVLDSLVSGTEMNLFCDVYFSPLHVCDLSKVIGEIVVEPIYGLYHCASSNSVSKYEFGMIMAKIFNISDSNIHKVSVDSLKLKARRPKNMALNVSKISKILKYNLPTVKDAIKLMKHLHDINIKTVNNLK